MTEQDKQAYFNQIAEIAQRVKELKIGEKSDIPLRLGLNGTGTIGDLLWTLVPAKVFSNLTIELHDDQQSREISILAEGLARVEFKNEPLPRLYIKNKDRIHTSQRILRELGLEGKINCIPIIRLKKNELIWVENYLRKFKNPIIISNDTGGGNDPTNLRGVYVRSPVENMQKMADYCISNGYQVLQLKPIRTILGSGYPSFTPLKNSIQLEGLNLRQQASILSKVGGIFSDSGLYHLALAVGNYACVSVPNESEQLGYQNWDLHYTNEYWKNEEIRIKYFNHKDILSKKTEVLDWICR